MKRIDGYDIVRLDGTVMGRRAHLKENRSERYRDYRTYSSVSCCCDFRIVRTLIVNISFHDTTSGVVMPKTKTRQTTPVSIHTGTVFE